MRYDDLQQGDGGGDGGEHHQQVEENAEERAHTAHTAEHILHGDEQQAGAAQIAVGVEGEAAGQHAQSRHEGHDGVHDNDQQAVLLNVLFLAQIRAVGDHSAHAQRQGEEHLAAGGGKYLEDVGCFFDHAVRNSPAGNKHILQAVHRAGQGTGADDADQQRDKQCGHTHGADLLDTAAHAAEDYEHGQRHEDQAIDNSLGGVGDQSRPGLGANGSAIGCRSLSKYICTKTGLEQVAHIENDILDAVAAQRAVEEQNEKCGCDTHPAHPFELLGDHPVRLDRALAGLTADGKLTDHHDEAGGDTQENIHHQECEAAIGTHLIGEAPDVAQTDRRADRGHQESEIGSKAFSFFHIFSPYDFPRLPSGRICILPREKSLVNKSKCFLTPASRKSYFPLFTTYKSPVKCRFSSPPFFL